MKQTKSGKKYAIISAIFFIYYVLVSVCSNINYTLSENADLLFKMIKLTLPFWIIVIALSITLLIGKIPPVLVTTILKVLLDLSDLINGVYITLLLEFFAYAALAVVLILSLRGNMLVKYLWFLPSAFMVLAFLITIKRLPWIGVILYLSIIAALFFAGLWAKQSMAPVRRSVIKAYSSPLRGDAPAKRQTDTVGGADRLKVYKDLLDIGAITQEEFDERKRQILHSDE